VKEEDKGTRRGQGDKEMGGQGENTVDKSRGFKFKIKMSSVLLQAVKGEIFLFFHI
jgi:hypothetical protein